MKHQKRNRQPPNSLRFDAEKKATSKRKRPNVSNVLSDPERPMAPRWNQNISASGSHSTPVMSSDVEYRVSRPESHDVATTIHRRAADNCSSIVSQVGMVPSIQDSHGLLLKSAADLGSDSTLDADFVLKGGVLTVVNKKPDSLNNIEIWTSAFMIYMAILLEKWSMKAQKYLKYMQSIRLASSRGTNNGWAVYDDQYRLKKEHFPSSSWGVIDQELLVLCVVTGNVIEIKGGLLITRVIFVATVEPVFNLAKNVGISTKAFVRLEENANLITNSQNVTGNTQLQVVELKNVKRCDLSDLYKLGNSPINVCGVEKCLLNYPEITAAAELIQGLRFGFKLMYAGPRFSFTCKNSKSVLKNIETTRKKLNKEIELGRIAGPFSHPPFPTFRCSPLLSFQKQLKENFA
ncbi:Hypothetical predicted protein [Mytilus galloprovincialis]|uniref:Uncharacterized protein n=1 Tax=Mytilus galloprovincialis TaxID=29158 RepID=A0A8B6CZX4_MYTGA|nr:Hypothetical predicted protein [Mytilus galloprovincialis]